jgi:N-acetyltransferase
MQTKMRRTYGSRPQKRKLSRSSSPEPTSESTPKRHIFAFLKATSKSNIISTAKPKKLVQVTLDLGQPSTITCPECRMSYTPSQPADTILHNKHHTKYLSGQTLEVPAAMQKSLTEGTNAVWHSGDNYIVRISKRDQIAKKNTAHKLVAGANADLGALEIKHEDLWGERKYQVFLYLSGRKCYGILLAEPITHALQVDNSDFPIILDEPEQSARMGISRIWTDGSQRRDGIATRLLSVSQKVFWPLAPIKKKEMAFSQPTEQGANLARKWFEREKGWLVYHD